ncbi:GumC domain-containing protein [Stieleria varia]|uniref:Uncharacterized protein n=1 Tax=Stieleria varia TaxID=2528005 RepID=A0A5C6AU03_9BACT|nr:hypothetical protein [Stieleria varia]TWU02957.1 hypothetical protein Pla52n_40460 [Stieleria varia]
MSAPPIPWKHLRNVLVLFAPLWLGATAIFGVCGLVYALFSGDVWTARQPLIVRDEASGAVDRLGRFSSQTELKAAQETVLEMCQNRDVVAAALRQIGPPAGKSDENWPSIATIDGTIKKSVNLRAPKGSEFGNTEVVYLQVNASDQQRALDFCEAMFDNLTEHLRNVRRVRADSVIKELTHARDLARQNLNEVSARMREVETQFGEDLGDLRNLNDTISGDGTNRRTLEETTRELQVAELELSKLESMYRLLNEGANDPQKLLISGSELLTNQPTLLRLKDGLIDAQLRSSELSGVYTVRNPKRRAAIAAEREIRDRIKQETVAVIESMKPTLELERERVAKLAAKKERLSSRLGDLANARTGYAKIDSELEQRTEQLADAERRLTDAHASRSAALSTNLVAALGPPQVSDNPVNAGTTTLTGGAAMAGLIFGLGAVFLIAPGPSESQGRRRWSDYVSGAGRRASDMAAVPAAPASTTDRRGGPPATEAASR